MDLIKTVYNNSILTYRCTGENCATKTATSYWLASRAYYKDENEYEFLVNYIGTSGNSYYRKMFIDYRFAGKTFYGENLSAAIRPIVTLKSNIKILSDGNDGTTPEKAYNLTI